MRVAEGCLERKLLKRGVISVMFADCGKFRGYVLPSLSVYFGAREAWLSRHGTASDTL